MVIDKYSIDGKVTGEVELADSVFKAKINDVLLYDLVKAANANLRQGTHSTKEQSAVSGGGIKPWRQKGTGRARQGSIRAAQWKGGGVIFGPKPRDYRVDLPKNIKREAIRSLLSLKLKEGSIKVVEDFTVKDGKTKEIAKIGSSLKISKGILLTDSEDKLLKRAIKNIPWFIYNNAKRISSRDVFYSRTVLITESAVNYLNSKYSEGNK
ncbi:MAG: 50S ribosomal protein L4 [Spirochaetes bacterium]|nr:50S ribosomal protein L4 [Spirochaetota bacterium]